MTAGLAHAPLPAIIVCESCKGDDGTTGAMLAASLVEALTLSGLYTSLRVAPVSCLNSCGLPVSLVLSGEGRAAYLFNRIQPAGDVSDIIATARAWLAAERGEIEDARACGRLRFCLAARIPIV